MKKGLCLPCQPGSRLAAPGLALSQNQGNLGAGRGRRSLPEGEAEAKDGAAPPLPPRGPSGRTFSSLPRSTSGGPPTRLLLSGSGGHSLAADGFFTPGRPVAAATPEAAARPFSRRWGLRQRFPADTALLNSAFLLGGGGGRQGAGEHPSCDQPWKGVFEEYNHLPPKARARSRQGSRRPAQRFPFSASLWPAANSRTVQSHPKDPPPRPAAPSMRRRASSHFTDQELRHSKRRHQYARGGGGGALLPPPCCGSGQSPPPRSMQPPPSPTPQTQSTPPPPMTARNMRGVPCCGCRGGADWPLLRGVILRGRLNAQPLRPGRRSPPRCHGPRSPPGLSTAGLRPVAEP